MEQRVTQVDRVPAYVRFASAEQGKMGATYDGIYWDPPQVSSAAAAHKALSEHEELLILAGLRVEARESSSTGSATHLRGARWHEQHRAKSKQL